MAFNKFTSHDFLALFFPDHTLHTITDLDYPVTTKISFYCSCNAYLYVDKEHLAMVGSTIKDAINGPLLNVPRIEKIQ